MKTKINWFITIRNGCFEVEPFTMEPEPGGLHSINVPNDVSLLSNDGYRSKKHALIVLIRHLNNQVDKNKAELGEILLKEQEKLLNEPEDNLYKQQLLEQEKRRREMEQKWLEAERAKK